MEQHPHDNPNDTSEQQPHLEEHGGKRRMMGRILHNLWSRQPLVLVLTFLVVVIVVLGVMLTVRKCEGGLYSKRYLSGGIPDLKLISRLDSIVNRPNPGHIYGLPAGEYEAVSGEIESGETFSRLLNQRFNVDIAVVNRLIELCNGKFNLRDLRAGRTYTAFLRADSAATLQYLVYERSLSDYVIFGTGDSLFVRTDHKETRTEERYAEGTIENSLSATIAALGINDDLTVRLAENIFQGTIDFHALQKGDKFRVLYEEQFIDSVSTGIGKIYGVHFRHAGKDFTAYRFTQDSESGYWSAKGVNLKTALLISPLAFRARMTSKFGVRVHPIRRIRSMHNGVDYACPTGTAVRSVGAGVVTRRGWDRGGGGNMVWVRHAGGLESGYLHLSRIIVSTGQRVSQGQTIAYSGNTGGSTGPHLDYRLKKGGKYLNPVKLTSEPGPPIKAGNKGAFNQMVADVDRVMDSYATPRHER